MVNLASDKEPKYYKHIFYHLLQNNWTTYIKCMIKMSEENVTINETEPVILVAPKYDSTYFIIYCSII